MENGWNIIEYSWITVDHGHTLVVLKGDGYPWCWEMGSLAFLFLRCTFASVAMDAVSEYGNVYHNYFLFLLVQTVSECINAYVRTYIGY